MRSGYRISRVRVTSGFAGEIAWSVQPGDPDSGKTPGKANFWLKRDA
jgi:hypothetical protein